MNESHGVVAGKCGDAYIGFRTFSCFCSPFRFPSGHCLGKASAFPHMAYVDVACINFFGGRNRLLWTPCN